MRLPGHIPLKFIPRNSGMKSRIPYHVTVSIKPFRATFVIENKKLYLWFLWFLHIDMTRVIEILTRVRQKLTYST